MRGYQNAALFFVCALLMVTGLSGAAQAVGGPCDGGHDFEEKWTIDRAATCLAPGEESRHCTRCAERTEIAPILQLEHQASEWLIDRPATLIEEGSRHKECQMCKTELSREVLTCPNPSGGQILLAVDTAVTAPGTTMRLPVTIYHNPGFAGFALDIQYNKAALTLTEISKGERLSGGSFLTNLAQDTVTWFAPENIMGDGVLLYLTFTVSPDAGMGDTFVSVAPREGLPGNFSNQSGQAVAATMVAGNLKRQAITLSDGQIQNGTLNFTVTNGDYTGLRLLIAYYNGGRMVTCDGGKTLEAAGRQSVPVNCLESYTEAKIFLLTPNWNATCPSLRVTQGGGN